MGAGGILATLAGAAACCAAGGAAGDMVSQPLGPDSFDVKYALLSTGLGAAGGAIRAGAFGRVGPQLNHSWLKLVRRNAALACVRAEASRVPAHGRQAGAALLDAAARRHS